MCLLALSVFLPVDKLQAVTPDCAGTLKTTGTFFQNYEGVEYSKEGLLIVNFKLNPIQVNGGTLNTQWLVRNDECIPGNQTTGATNKKLPIPRGYTDFSIRFSSPTHYNVWNNVSNTPLTCLGLPIGLQGCSVDIPDFPDYYTFSLLTYIDTGILHTFLPTYNPIVLPVTIAPVLTDTLTTPEGCPAFSIITGLFFDNYERAEYAPSAESGENLLRVHYRLKSPNNQGGAWKMRVLAHDEDCRNLSVSSWPTTANVSLPAYKRYYSYRFDTPTHWQMYDDESNTPIVCGACQGTIPLTIRNAGGVDKAVRYASFASQAGPTHAIYGTPFPIVEPNKRIDPVLVIPGILGSWQKDGTWVLDPVQHTYDNLLLTLEGNGYVEGQTLFALPYDWRNSNVVTADLLKTKIAEIKSICNCDKVDLVAHSMGGLVARSYVQGADYADDVDQVIFLATPHLGSPDSYLSWEGGEFTPRGSTDKFKRFIFSREAKKEGYSNIFSYVRLKPIESIRELLPVYSYLKDASTGQLRVYPDSYPTNPFLENLSNLHDLVDSKVDVSNIVAKDPIANTISTIRTLASQLLPLWLHGYPEQFDNANTDRGLELGVGDGTVPEVSSNFLGSATKIELESTHTAITTAAEGQIYKLLTGKLPIYLSQIDFGTNITYLFIKLLSPVDMQIIAPDGKRVGIDFATGGELSEIEGAFYSGNSTDDEYVVIPNPQVGDYIVRTLGTGLGGEYTVATALISDINYADADLQAISLPKQEREVELSVAATTLGARDVSVLSDAGLVGNLEQMYALGWITSSKFRDRLTKVLNKIDRLVDKRDKIDLTKKKAEKRIERLSSKIDKATMKLIDKLLAEGLANGDITQDGYNLVIQDLNSVI